MPTRTNTWSDPTLVAVRSLALPLEGLTMDTVRLAAPALAQRLRLWERGVRAIARQGGRILVGSDAWNRYVMPGFGLHDEMELLVLQGISPLTVLRAGTQAQVEDLLLLTADRIFERYDVKLLPAWS